MKNILDHAFESYLGAWPELAGFAGFATSTQGLSSLAPGLAQDRIRGLEELAKFAPDPHDGEVLLAQAALFQWLLDGGRWKLNPDVLGEWSALLLRQALACRNAPRERERLESWLVSMPAMLPPGREGRESPDPMAKALAIDAARGMLDQVQALTDLCSTSSVMAAVGALSEHLAWLESLTPGARLAPLGTEGCEQLFQLRHLRAGPAEVRDLLHQEVTRCRTKLPADLAEERRRSRKHHASSFEFVIEEMRAHLAAAHQASVDMGFPPYLTARVEVLATPQALVPSIPGAAAFTPRFFVPEESGLVVLTPPDDLGRFGSAYLANLAAHEGHPGHGLQAALANGAGRAWRAVDLCPIAGLGAGLFACELMEGWAHYAEMRVAEESSGDDAQLLFAQRDEALWRAVRGQVDLGLALGDLDEAAAEHLLVSEAGLSPEAAKSEIADYRLQPTYGLSYSWGKLEVRRLRSKWMGTEAERHRKLLCEGLVPLAMIEGWVNSAR